MPLVTIITPTYNRANYLAETVDSVLLQDYPKIEYIVLDDGSTDNTLEILKCYEGRILCETHPNMGETRTVNRGFQMSRGDIICVVNSDDPLLPGAVSAAVKALVENPDRLVAYTDWNEIGPKSELIRHHILPDYDIISMLSDFNVSMGPGTFFRRSAIEKFGLRKVERKYTGDLEFWFRIALYEKPVHVPQLLATHRTHPEAASVTARGPQMADELIKIVKEIYSSTNLPVTVERIKCLTFCNVHFTAGLLSLSYPFDALKNFNASFIYDPLQFFLFLARLFFKGIKIGLRWVYLVILYSIFFMPKVIFRIRYGHVLKSEGVASEKPKFAFVSHVLPPSWSGQAVVIERLLRTLKDESYCLISREDFQQQKGQIRQLPGKYFHLSPEKKLPRNGFFLHYINIFLTIFQRGWNIADILVAEKCQSAVVGTGDLVNLPATYFASFLSGVKCYGYIFDDYVCQWTGVMRRMARMFEWMILPQLNGIIVPNEFMWKELNTRREVNAFIIRNPCDEETREQKLEQGKLTGDEIRILYTGSIYHVNFGAIKTLITALERLNRPEIRLHLYTAQPEDWLVQNGIKGDHVVHHKHASHTEVTEAQSSAHILFIPFDFNSPVPEVVRTSAPGKLGDYLACGTPILAHVPPDTFVKWYLTEHQCGIVVDRDNPEDVMKAVLRLLEDRDLRQSIRMQAWKRARIDFDSRDSQRKLMEMLAIHHECI